MPSDPMETAARAWRAAQDAVEPKVLRYLRQKHGEDGLRLASSEFGLPYSGLHAEGPESQLFLPWVLYDWQRDAIPCRLLLPCRDWS